MYHVEQWFAIEPVVGRIPFQWRERNQDTVQEEGTMTRMLAGAVMMSGPAQHDWSTAAIPCNTLTPAACPGPVWHRF